MKKILPMVVLAFGAFFAACGGDPPCLTLGLKECACCDQADVPTCQKSVRDSYTTQAPTSAEEDTCSADLAQFKTCDQLDQNALANLCAGNL